MSLRRGLGSHAHRAGRGEATPTGRDSGKPRPQALLVASNTGARAGKEQDLSEGTSTSHRDLRAGS